MSRFLQGALGLASWLVAVITLSDAARETKNANDKRYYSQMLGVALVFGLLSGLMRLGRWADTHLS